MIISKGAAEALKRLNGDRQSSGEESELGDEDRRAAVAQVAKYFDFEDLPPQIKGEKKKHPRR